jgi:hypothetical protein
MKVCLISGAFPNYKRLELMHLVVHRKTEFELPVISIERNESPWLVILNDSH